MTIAGWIKALTWLNDSNWASIILRKDEANPNNWQLQVNLGQVVLVLDDYDAYGIRGNQHLVPRRRDLGRRVCPNLRQRRSRQHAHSPVRPDRHRHPRRLPRRPNRVYRYHQRHRQRSPLLQPSPDRPRNRGPGERGEAEDRQLSGGAAVMWIVMKPSHG